jgi:hypothetical protein
MPTVYAKLVDGEESHLLRTGWCNAFKAVKRDLLIPQLE